MDDAGATKILLGLQGHYPGLAGTKEAAKDWIEAIMNTPDPEIIANQFTFRWENSRAPRLSDWMEVARGQRDRSRDHLRVVGARERELPAPRIDRERLHELVEACRLQAEEHRWTPEKQAAQPLGPSQKVAARMAELSAERREARAVAYAQAHTKASPIYGPGGVVEQREREPEPAALDPSDEPF